MKRGYFFYLVLLLFIFIISFFMPFISSISTLKISAKNSNIKSLEAFIEKNSFIDKDSVVKIDDNYYYYRNDDSIIDVSKMSFVKPVDVIKNMDLFKELLFKELRIKYPLFVVEQIINNDFDSFIVSNDRIDISYLTTEGNKYDVTLVCRDYKNLVSFGCVDDIQGDPNSVGIDSSKKSVALTFDDGPCVYTNDVIDLLLDFNMKATFFELGSLMERYPEIVKRVLDSGFEVGSHGYNHKAFTKLKVGGTLKDISRTNDIYREISGRDLKLVRPPYGSINASIRDSVDVTFVKWSVDSLDWKVRDERYVENVMSVAKDGDIILLHDIHKTTLEHLRDLLTRLYNENFQVVTVSELASIKGIPLESRKVYFKFV